MSNPIKQYLSDNHVEVYAWGAAPYIKKALGLNADTWVSIPDEIGVQYVLLHNAALRPINKLPWPLSKIQPHDVELITISEEIHKLINPALKELHVRFPATVKLLKTSETNRTRIELKTRN